MIVACHSLAKQSQKVRFTTRRCGVVVVDGQYCIAIPVLYNLFCSKLICS
jgi:hypothetical protein